MGFSCTLVSLYGAMKVVEESISAMDEAYGWNFLAQDFEWLRARRQEIAGLTLYIIGEEMKISLNAL